MANRPTSIYSLSDEDISLRTINMGIYAHPGAGKTVFAGSKGKGTLILDSDGGGSLAAAAQGSEAEAMPCNDYDDLQSIYEHLRYDDHGYDWVWWDSMTLFQERALIDEILVEAHAENPRQSEDVASQREYLINMNRIGKFTRQFVDLPINFGVTFHVMAVPDPEGELIYMPAVQGKNMPSKISGYMNVIGHLGKATTERNGKKVRVRRMLWQQHEHYYAKDRFDALGATMDAPSIPKCEKLIDAKRQEMGKKPAPATRSRSRKAASTK